MNSSSCAFEIISDTVQKPGNSLSVKDLCAMTGVSRSGYYSWLAAESSRGLREQQDRDDFELILSAYRMRNYSKGAKVIHMALLHMNPPVVMNLKKIRRLMEKFNLSCPIRKTNPYRRMAKMLKTNNAAGNILQRKFEQFGPRMVLLTDITYLPYNGKFAYLSTIMDAYMKQILSLETVTQLMEKHGISLHAETLIHSDQGCHYTSRKFIDIIYDKALRRSMSRRGNCWDNAPQKFLRPYEIPY